MHCTGQNSELAAREAEVGVRERDLARPLLLLGDLLGQRRLGDALLLQAALNQLDAADDAMHVPR